MFTRLLFYAYVEIHQVRLVFDQLPTVSSVFNSYHLQIFDSQKKMGSHEARIVAGIIQVSENRKLLSGEAAGSRQKMYTTPPPQKKKKNKKKKNSTGEQ